MNGKHTIHALHTSTVRTTLLRAPKNLEDGLFLPSSWGGQACLIPASGQSLLDSSAIEDTSYVLGCAMPWAEELGVCTSMPQCKKHHRCHIQSQFEKHALTNGYLQPPRLVFAAAKR